MQQTPNENKHKYVRVNYDTYFIAVDLNVTFYRIFLVVRFGMSQ